MSKVATDCLTVYNEVQYYIGNTQGLHCSMGVECPLNIHELYTTRTVVSSTCMDMIDLPRICIGYTLGSQCIPGNTLGWFTDNALVRYQ